MTEGACRLSHPAAGTRRHRRLALVAVTVTWQGHGCEHAPPHTVLFRRESPHGAPPAGAARPVPRAESPFPLLGILRKPVVPILHVSSHPFNNPLTPAWAPGSRFTPDVPARDFSKVLVERKIRPASPPNPAD